MKIKTKKNKKFFTNDENNSRNGFLVPIYNTNDKSRNCILGCDNYNSEYNRTLLNCSVPEHITEHHLDQYCYDKIVYNIDLCCLEYDNDPDCHTLYEKCLENSNVSVLDLFEKPINIHTISYKYF